MAYRRSAFIFYILWLSQAKANSGDYKKELADRFRKLIVDAFEIGRNCSNDQRWF